MPYDAEKPSDVTNMKKKLEKTYKNVSDTAARQAIHIWNSIMDEHNDEGRAWAGVYSKMNDRLTKKAVNWMKDRGPEDYSDKELELYGAYTFWSLHHDGSPQQRNMVRKLERELNRLGFNGWGLDISRIPQARREYLRLTKKYHVQPEAVTASAARVASAFLHTAALNNIAKTILNQMGGVRRIISMLNTQHIVGLPNGVKIMWPNRQRSKGNMVQITLNPTDTYTMTFYNVSPKGIKKVKTFQGLYNDQLIPTFERHTGWYLSI